MARSDRVRWDLRYARNSGTELTAPEWLAEVAGLLPRQGQGLDVAAGTGRLALWLARRGLDVLAVDISSVGLRQAQRAAQDQGLQLRTLVADLEVDPLPGGSYDVITCFNYRQRSLFPMLRERLKPGGLLIAELATVANLERHSHPSLQYLARPGELREDCAPLEVVYYREGWFTDRASARVVARLPRRANRAL